MTAGFFLAVLFTGGFEAAGVFDFLRLGLVFFLAGTGEVYHRQVSTESTISLEQDPVLGQRSGGNARLSAENSAQFDSNTRLLGADTALGTKP